ncbi:hypothetical protein QF001_003777 [Paraburkholderia youngii]|uniref:hypothetical protein n=1 Tax=Paraburkholderia youngii TaxID=2782701 RepID=UPI003D252158
MAQVPNYQVPAHPSGLDMRLQLNEIVLALVGDNAGPSEPPETFPGMWWGDTTAGRLRRRNNVNDAWINVGPLDDPLADIRQLVYDTANWKVDKRGDYMSGGLFMRATPIYWQNAAANANFGYISSFGNPGQAGSGIGFVDASLTLWNFQVEQTGRCVVRNGFEVSNGASDFWAPLYLRGRGPAGEIQLFSNDNTRCIMRGRVSGGGMDWVNDAYNAIIMQMDNGGSLSWGLTGAQLLNNGNLFMQFRNGWLSDVLYAHDVAAGQIGGKATANVYAQHGWDFAEFASVEGGNNVVDISNPWYVMGLRITTSYDINRIYQRARPVLQVA